MKISHASSMSSSLTLTPFSLGIFCFSYGVLTSSTILPTSFAVLFTPFVHFLPAAAFFAAPFPVSASAPADLSIDGAPFTPAPLLSISKKNIERGSQKRLWLWCTRVPARGELAPNGKVGNSLPACAIGESSAFMVKNAFENKKRLRLGLLLLMDYPIKSC
jgi:hypothetical protein